tara:strand:- start:378 stop:1034 length:657 start_codon:yes stop_codon:yes gene_type:complete
MSKLPYMQFFPEDWINGTRFLTQEEKGIYIDMIAMSWDKPIPKERLPFLVNTTWEKLSDYIKDKFIDLGETIINKRVYKDVSAYEEYIEKQRVNGQKGGRPKTQKNHSNSNSNSNSNTNTNSKSKIPTELEFLDYGLTIIKQLNKNPKEFEFSLKAKYHSWIDEGWKTGHGKKIKNWKNTLNNTIPHLKPIYNGRTKNNTGQISDSFAREIAEGLQSK